MEFKFVEFESLFDIPLKNGLSKPKKVRGSGSPMVNMGEIFKYDFIYDIDMDLVPMTEKEKSHSYLKKKDLLFARQSLTLAGAGKCSIFLGENFETTYESHLIRVRLNEEKCNPLFYYYYFHSPHGKVNISNIVEQVAAAGIRGSDLKKLKVPYIEKNIQNKVVELLFDFDKKINLNEKTIKNLEQISQALFKHWFIDFEFPNEEGKPYKSSGGEMIGCALDCIPINWENTNLKYLSKNIFAGGTPNRKEESYWTNPEIPWLKTKEITNNFILNTEEYISLEGLKNSSAKWANPNSIVIAMYGATAGRVGYIANKLTTNQASCVIETNYPNYVWSYLKKNQEHIKTMATGSAQQNLNKSVISNLKIPHPGNELLELYEAFVSPNTELCINLCKENDNLQQLRDTLLPKLLSGEIEIPDELEV